jgi:endonuclease V-like protein UPF0215 family
MEAVRFYSIKDEIRVIGIDDAPFDLHHDKKTMIIGAIFRGGSFLDGVLRTEVEVDGTDSTDKIIKMLSETKHRDIRVIMLDGLGFAGFNLVDVKRLFTETGLPVIVVVRQMPDFLAIEEAIKKLANREFYRKCIRIAGKPSRVETSPGKFIHIQCCGISFSDAAKIVRLSSTRSLIPEPLRVAHLIATGVTLGESRGGA